MLVSRGRSSLKLFQADLILAVTGSTHPPVFPDTTSKTHLKSQYECLGKCTPLVAELEKAIAALESALEDYFKIQSNLKTILGDKYDEHYYGKSQKVQQLVEEKIHECNVRIE